MSNTIFDEHMVSCVKRKDVKEIVAVLLEKEGKEEEAKAWRDTSRVTDKLINTTIAVKSTDDEAEVETPAEEVAEAPEELTYADQDQIQDELGETIDALTGAIAKGKKKKAKKLVKVLEESGLKGSVFKDLKKQVKAL